MDAGAALGPKLEERYQQLAGRVEDRRTWWWARKTLGLSVAQWTDLPWWEQRFLIEMQAADDTRDEHIAKWREENAKRQRRNLPPLPYREPGTEVEEPIRLADHLRRKQAERGAGLGSPFKITEV